MAKRGEEEMPGRVERKRWRQKIGLRGGERRKREEGRFEGTGGRERYTERLRERERERARERERQIVCV